MSRAGAASRASAGRREPGRTFLHLVDERPAAPDRPHAAGPVAPGGCGERVLVAGADPAARAHMLAELRSLLPADTVFREASETWEVIAQASQSRMVVLAGDLGETSASTLLRRLARRNPALPVLAVGGDRRASYPVPGPGSGRYRPTAGAVQA